MALNTAALFDQPDYSDVIVSYSGRKTYCHKIILCTSSDYFKKLCGPGSHFVESKQDTIELKEDYHDAVYHLLRYVYTGNDDCGDRENDYALQLEISKVAQKYLYPELHAKAIGKFRTLFTSITDPTEVFDSTTHVRNASDEEEVLKLADEVQERHILPLLKVPGFRDHVENREETWRYLDEYVDFKAGLQKLRIAWCSICKEGTLLLDGTLVGEPHTHYIRRPLEVIECWIPKGSLDPPIPEPATRRAALGPPIPEPATRRAASSTSSESD